MGGWSQARSLSPLEHRLEIRSDVSGSISSVEASRTGAGSSRLASMTSAAAGSRADDFEARARGVSRAVWLWVRCEWRPRRR